MPESQQKSMRCDPDHVLILIGQLISRSMDDADASISQLTQTVQKIIHKHNSDDTIDLNYQEAAQCMITAMQFYDLLSQRLRHIQTTIENKTLADSDSHSLLEALSHFPGGRDLRQISANDKLEFF